MPEEAELHPLSSPAPAQPAIVMRLLEMLGGEAILPPDCARVLGLDPAMVLWVMTAAAQSARHRQLPTVEDALQGLSLQGLKSRVLQEALELLVRRQHPSDRIQTWRQSLRCASLCKALALELAYPQPHEAHLAGLLHNLGPVPPMGWDLDHLLQERDAALAARVEAWRYPSLLPDALRYQHWPLQALRDAAGIVQMLWASRSLVEQDGRASEQEIGQLLGIVPERLASLTATAFERAESLLGAYLDGASTISNLQELPLQLLEGLARFTLLEQMRTSLAEQPGGMQGVSLHARHLQEAHGSRRACASSNASSRYCHRCAAIPIDSDSCCSICSSTPWRRRRNRGGQPGDASHRQPQAGASGGDPGQQHRSRDRARGPGPVVRTGGAHEGRGACRSGPVLRALAGLRPARQRLLCRSQPGLTTFQVLLPMNDGLA